MVVVGLLNGRGKVSSEGGGVGEKERVDEEGGWGGILTDGEWRMGWRRG